MLFNTLTLLFLSNSLFNSIAICIFKTSNSTFLEFVLVVNVVTDPFLFILYFLKI